MTIYVVIHHFGYYEPYESSQDNEEMVKGFTTEEAARRWIVEHENDKDSDGEYLYRLGEEYDDYDDPDVWNNLYVQELEVEE